MSAPDRIWMFASELKRFAPGGGMISMGDTEYRRADLPPTLSEALAVPEVRALVEAVRHEREMPCQDIGMQLAASEALEAALARIKDAAP
jgi:hypothetical protein